ncbi:MAG: flagellar basal body-associated FliL family protein [Ghiorsea sp.]
MADEKEAEEGKKSSGGLLPIINLVLLILVLAVGGFIAWKMMEMQQPPAIEDTTAPVATAETEMPEPEEEDPEAPPVFVDIADITINLADEDVSRFLRAKIKLELRNADAQVKVENNMIKINDMVITYLASKTFAEIRTPQGKYELKETLLIRMNRFMTGKPIKNLYFTDFVSQ